jgi:hypothetical protein
MKIIDKTPLLNEKGELGILQRVQGMLKYGFSWPSELQAQDAIVKFFDRSLERGYTLIRNMTLGASGIMVPIILLGPAGIYVIHITYMRGRYEAKGNAWNDESGRPAPVNLIDRTARMARAVKAFVERQGVNLPIDIEPVLIAGDPGLHIESVRPAIKVMMIDGIKPFASGLATGRPALSAEAVHEFTERIVNPRLPKKETVAPHAPPPAPRSSPEQEAPTQEVSRARAIFNAAEQAKPFDPADFDFAMVDEQASSAGPASEVKPGAQARRRRILGMSPLQFAIVSALALALICLLAAFAYLFFFVF